MDKETEEKFLGLLNAYRELHDYYSKAGAENPAYHQLKQFVEDYADKNKITHMASPAQIITGSDSTIYGRSDTVLIRHYKKPETKDD